MSQRPDNFTLNMNASLAKGLVFAGLGRAPGSTRYHDIAPAVDRVEIGYTWVARRWQRSRVNKACKLLLPGAEIREVI